MKTAHTVIIIALIAFGVLCIAAGIVMVSGVIGGSDDDTDDTKAEADLPPTQPGLQVDEALSSNLTVVLKGTPATDPEAGALVYYWDMGDGTKPVQGPLEFTYTYEANGSYAVTLIVFDGKNYNSSCTRVSVGGPAGVEDNGTSGIDEEAKYDYDNVPAPGLGGGDDDDDSGVPTKNEDGNTKNTIFSTNSGDGVRMAGAATIAIGVVVIAIAIIIIVVLVAVVKRKNAAEAASKKTSGPQEAK